MKCRMNCDGRKTWLSIRTVVPAGALVVGPREPFVDGARRRG
jgi:hypothetical protein